MGALRGFLKGGGRVDEGSDVDVVEVGVVCWSWDSSLRMCEIRSVVDHVV